MANMARYHRPFRHQALFLRLLRKRLSPEVPQVSKFQWVFSGRAAGLLSRRSGYRNFVQAQMACRIECKTWIL